MFGPTGMWGWRDPFFQDFINVCGIKRGGDIGGYRKFGPGGPRPFRGTMTRCAGGKVWRGCAYTLFYRGVWGSPPEKIWKIRPQMVHSVILWGILNIWIMVEKKMKVAEGAIFTRGLHGPSLTIRQICFITLQVFVQYTPHVFALYGIIDWIK